METSGVIPAYVANFSLEEQSSIYVTPILMIGEVPMPTRMREIMNTGR